MLCYFKKKRMTLPKPVIFCISKYIQTSHINIISEIDTLFPSNLKQIKNKLYVKGGMFLLRLKKETLHKNNLVQINMKYKNAIDNKKYEISSIYGFDIFEKVDYFSDEKIEKALGLYYMAKYNRILMKYCNKESKSKNKFIEKIIIKNRMEEMNKTIEKFFESHFHDETNSQNYNKYVNNMKKIRENSNRYIKDNIHKIKSKEKLSINEFIKAGNYLISKFPEWKWCPLKENINDNEISNNKGYLKAIFYSSQRVKNHLNEISNIQKEKDTNIENNDEIIENDTYDEDNNNDNKNIKLPKNKNRLRIYELYITYDSNNYIPKIWLKGYDYHNNELNLDEIKEDILTYSTNDFCSFQLFPFENFKCVTMHPEKYIKFFKKIPIYSEEKEKSILLLIKNMHRIIPTIIKGDYIKQININI